jgi:lysophospholipase L1-like esterase
MKKALQIALIITFSVITTLLIGELLVRLFIPQQKMVTWLEMHSSGFMMNQTGGEAFHEHHGREITYRFNHHRLRGAEPDTTSYTILAMGDSFTFGLLLNEADTYTERLNQLLNQNLPDPVQVLNGGIGGSGTADQLLWLQEFGDTINPDMVLIFLNTDDIDRSVSKNLFLYPDFPQTDSLTTSQRWTPGRIQKSIHNRRWYRTLQRHSHLANISVKVLWRYFYFHDLTRDFNPEKSTVPLPPTVIFTEDTNYGASLGNALFSEIQNWSAVRGCETVITTTGFFADDEISFHTEKFYSQFAEFSLMNGLTFIDNTPCLSGKLNGNYNSIIIPLDTHPDESGARMIAECTAARLIPLLETDS